MSDQSAIPKTAKQRGKISPVKLAHIVYKTSRFDEMIDWYKTVLEAETMTATPVVTFLTYDDEHHRIAIANMPNLEKRPFQSAGVEHCAFTYGSLDDLFATYERLAAIEIMPYWTINHGPTLSMYYRDPDDNQVELQIDIFENNDEVNEWFEQSDFTINPIGVKFDAVELIGRYRAGEDRTTLLARRRIDPTELVEQFPAPPE
ncbi:MAG: VOC family protein [Gammaproteobacteria bacterium]|nr:VOC family protein [Gammaproteobacteria bacterium]MDE0989273.1 VOC family protein [Pseudomonadales bacterium]